MEVVKVATTTSFHWSRRHTAIPQCPCFSQTLSSSKRQRSRRRTGDAAVGGSLACQARLKPSNFLGTQSVKLHRFKSCELWEFSNSTTKKIRTGVQKLDPLDLPLSLRIIKKKLQEKALKEKEASGESSYCSINRAFSSMVFMIEELHSFASQTRVGVLRQVKKDMHASLLWIFQRVFSQSPILMVYVMILLANYTVRSVASSLAITVSPPHSAVTKDAPAVTKGQDVTHQTIDISSRKKSTESSGAGMMDLGPLVSGTDGNGFDRSKWLGSITFDKVSHLPTHLNSVSEEGMREEEVSLWNSMVEEADQMQDSPIDRDVRLILVSPIIAKIELEDYANYTRTELSYKIGLAQEPNNPLLLVNYAQFLYLVTQDYNRAEKCFKKALKSEEVDAETYRKYAIFLWKVKNDLWAAEDNFLEAISADPTNSFYAANYADFLWQTGGEETCFPFETSDWWIY